MDRNISALTVTCAVFWTIGAAFIVLNVIYPSQGLGHLGIFSTAIAAVLQVHRMFRALVRREECAYHLGVLIGGGSARTPSADVRSLR